LRFFSVFGAVTNTPVRPDCSDAQVSSTPFDANRTQQDPAGITQKYLTVMPHTNIYDVGDGLNTAGSQWLRSGHSSGEFGLANGTVTDADRKQINLKVDHNFNASNKVAVNYSYEWIDADNISGGAASSWPGYYPAQVIRRPRVFTVNFTSTVLGNKLNEARFGYRANKHGSGLLGSHRHQQDRGTAVAVAPGRTGFSDCILASRRRSDVHQQLRVHDELFPTGQSHSIV
jgi:hypothetical protein